MKKETKEHFELESVDTIYILFEYFLRIWCERKEVLNQNTANNQQTQQFVTYEDIEKFFQNHIKNISFGFTSPTSSFSGRLKELDDIRDKLQKQPDLIVSQSLAICGLGGIGKTELIKKFIHKFGKSDFYGRVIWIEADNDEVATKSFTELAERLDIKDRKNKAITTIIAEVFQYFDELKVLFVFDNYDVNPAGKFNLSLFYSNFFNGLLFLFDQIKRKSLFLIVVRLQVTQRRNLVHTLFSLQETGNVYQVCQQ